MRAIAARASGRMRANICQTWNMRTHNSSSTSQPAARRRSALRTTSSRSASSLATRMRVGGRQARRIAIKWRNGRGSRQRAGGPPVSEPWTSVSPLAGNSLLPSTRHLERVSRTQQGAVLPVASDQHHADREPCRHRRHPPGIEQISMTGSSGNILADDDSMTCRNVRATTQASPPPLLRSLWQERYRMVLGWLTGISAGALWVYSGMPMICH